MKNDSKPKKAKPITVDLTVSKADDFKGRKRTGLTFREYKELTDKDRLTLTPSEQKRLGELHRHFTTILQLTQKNGSKN